MKQDVKTKVKAFFSTPFSKTEKKNFQEEVVRSSKSAFYISLALIIVFELFNIIYVAFFTKNSIFGPRNRYYFALYLFLFLISVGCSLFLIFRSRTPKTLLTLGNFYAICCCLWATGITVLDLTTNASSISVYTVVLIGAAIFAFITPANAILLFGGNHLLFLALYCLYCNPEGIGVFLNTTVIAAVSISISVNRYHSKQVEYQSKRQVLRQNERMTQMLEQLNRLVMLDTLTDSYNRRFLEEVLPEKWNENQRLNHSAAAIMLDLDHFKQYNDRYGHQPGDACLKEIAELMKHAASGIDDYLVRYGGEEFTLILLNRTEEEVVDLAEQIRRNVEKLRLDTGKGEAGKVTVSEGVCFCETAAEISVKKILGLSDEALYEAKRQGRNRIIMQRPEKSLSPTMKTCVDSLFSKNTETDSS